MRKLIGIMLSLIVLTTIGCSKTSDLRYGEYVEGKYVNKQYKFSMEIPSNWEVNEDIERVNGTEEVPEDIEELIIALMYPSSNDRSNGFTILALNKEDGIKGFVSEMSDSDLLKDTYNEDINGKEFTVLQYENGLVYLTESNDRIIEFSTTYSDDTKKEEMKRAIKSIEFEQ